MSDTELDSRPGWRERLAAIRKYRYPVGSVKAGLDAAADTLQERLFAAPASVGRNDPTGPSNLVGLGIAEKLVHGRRTRTKSIVVYVRKKFPLSKVPASSRVPRDVDGYLTDVVAVGRTMAAFGSPFAGTHRASHDVVPAGVCIGVPRTNHCGTLGWFVKKDGQLCLLTAQHVVSTGGRPPQRGAEVRHPAPTTKRPGRTIGSVVDFGGIDRPTGIVTGDWALAAVAPDDVVLNVLGIGRVGRGVRDVSPSDNGLKVRKSGRQSGVTLGVVQTVLRIAKVEYGDETMELRNVVFVGRGGTLQRFARSGDSGALVVEHDAPHRPIGLLVAGSPWLGYGYVIPLRTILEESGATLVH